MKDKNLMLFGLGGRESSLKGIAIFLFIYFGATLFAAILTPLFYWLAQWAYNIDPHFLGIDLEWLLKKGVDDFFDRIRYVPIVLGLPIMMKVCGLFSIKYIGLSINKQNIITFLRTFIAGVALAFVIFFMQYKNAQKPTSEINLMLPCDAYSFTLSLGKPVPDTVRNINFEIKDENISKENSFNLEDGKICKITNLYKNKRQQKYLVKIELPELAQVSILKNSQGENLPLTNIVPKKKETSQLLTLIAKSFLCGLVGAFLVALLEEVLFRCLIFRSAYTAWGSLWGVIFASAFFAYKHFHVPSSIWQNIPGGECHAEWYTGFIVAYYDTVGVFMNFDLTIFTALFLFGCLLCLFYMKTRILWGSIGFHAGIVATMFAYSDSFIVNPNATQKFWFGTEMLSDSIFSIIALSIIIAILVFSLRTNKRNLDEPDKQIA